MDVDMMLKAFYLMITSDQFLIFKKINGHYYRQLGLRGNRDWTIVFNTSRYSLDRWKWGL